MSKYRLRATVEAMQWFKDGDRSCVTPLEYYTELPPCMDCKHPLCEHGTLDDEDNCPVRVCPGDWIIDGTPCPSVVSNTAFNLFYEKVEE